ncbi:MAG: phosphatidylglycerophosphatase A [Bacteroidetes bacterium]|nr:MAG: phosphatidylglycerophosphatase A [Bacteroidota bacterium]
MKKFYKVLLTGFGAGWMPVAPGTWGAGLALVLAWPIAYWFPQNLVVMLVVLILAGTWLGAQGSAIVADEWGKDPSQTVLDEMVGMWISLLVIPFAWPWWLAAFLLFRLFDIFKPLGIRQLESVGKGWGVMLDDVLAGIYTNLALQAVWMLL